MKIRIGLIATLLLSLPSLLFSQDYVIKLYEKEIPNLILSTAKENTVKGEVTIISNVQNPDISVYLPSKKMTSGRAVIICPGGGYEVEVTDWEGTDVAHYLNTWGIAAIVLKYRLPTSGNTKIPYKAPIQDAQRAMRLVRLNAHKWNINPERIGIMGFSAGGHLAATLGTQFDNGNKNAVDSVEKVSCRPDFMVLVYPVISMVDSCTHIGSRNALFGVNPSPSLFRAFSPELQVKVNTPPTFLVHSNKDTIVPSENSLLMYNALQKKHISAELHILSEGEHGFGMNINNEHIDAWVNNLAKWLKSLDNI